MKFFGRGSEYLGSYWRQESWQPCHKASHSIQYSFHCDTWTDHAVVTFVAISSSYAT